MSHEVTKTWEIDGWYHVIPSKGKNKGKTLKKFKSEKAANAWAKKRSEGYKGKEKVTHTHEEQEWQNTTL